MSDLRTGKRSPRTRPKTDLLLIQRPFRTWRGEGDTGTRRLGDKGIRRVALTERALIESLQEIDGLKEIEPVSLLAQSIYYRGRCLRIIKDSLFSSLITSGVHLNNSSLDSYDTMVNCTKELIEAYNERNSFITSPKR